MAYGSSSQGARIHASEVAILTIRLLRFRLTDRLVGPDGISVPRASDTERARSPDVPERHRSVRAVLENEEKQCAYLDHRFTTAGLDRDFRPWRRERNSSAEKDESARARVSAREMRSGACTFDHANVE